MTALVVVGLAALAIIEVPRAWRALTPARRIPSELAPATPQTPAVQVGAPRAFPSPAMAGAQSAEPTCGSMKLTCCIIRTSSV
jgi:hypothetical protein